MSDFRPHHRVITLTTDFGTRDGYVGMMKGVILSINPAVQLVDITHEINPQDVLGAAFVIANSYPYFAEGAIHVVVVDPGVGSERKPIVVETESHLFIGPDNGVFGLVYHQERVYRVIEIINPKFLLPELSDTFHGRDIFAPVAGHLSLGVDLAEFGPELEEYQRIDFPEPRMTEDGIEARIVHVDRFGNLITNISRGFFEKIIAKKPFEIAIGGEKVSRISKSYADVEEGGVLAIFGSSGFLEISVNKGNAQERLGLKKGDAVRCHL